MGLIKDFDKVCEIKDNRISLTPEYIKDKKWQFKKITGSRFGSVLGLNKYCSEFKAWTQMVNLFKDSMDPTLANAGNIIEPKIRDYVQDELNIRYTSYEPSVVKWDVFKSNEIFGGIPDGEPVDNNNILSYSNGEPMLEIKTASKDSLVYKFNEENCMLMQKDANGVPLVKEIDGKRKTWFDSNDQPTIPKEYLLQLGLYLYLRNQTKGVVAVAFLLPEDYADPKKFDISKREKAIINIDYDLNEIKSYIDQATQWYKKYINGGVSPEMTVEDIKWLEKEKQILRNQ